MDWIIRQGIEADIDAVAALYDEVSAHLEATVNYPGWKQGVYPARPDAEAAVEEGTLFLAEQGGEVAGSFILRPKQEDAYAAVTWQAELAEEDVRTVYTFAVSPRFPRQGVGRQMLEFAVQYARAQGAKAIRLDVSEGNLPAARLYEACGFRYIGTVSLGLEDIGLDWFWLYEKLL